MIKMRIAIIGGGVAGLYLTYVLKKKYSNIFNDIKLISDNPRAFASRFANQYIFLRYDLRIRNLLKMLNVKYKKNNFKMGFWYNERLYSRPDYYMLDAYNQKIYGKKTKSAMNFKSSYPIIDCDYMKMTTALEDYINNCTNFDKIKEINMKLNGSIQLIGNNVYETDILVSTIPLPIFNKISGNEDFNKYLKANPIALFKSDFDAKEYNQVSNCEPDSPITRYVKTSEMTTQEILAEPNKQYSNAIVYLQYGKIFGGESDKIKTYLKSLERKNIYMSGRFAQFEAHLDTEDILGRDNEIIAKLVK